jgi:hypothetical protein
MLGAAWPWGRTERRAEAAWPSSAQRLQPRALSTSCSRTRFLPAPASPSGFAAAARHELRRGLRRRSAPPRQRGGGHGKERAAQATLPPWKRALLDQLDKEAARSARARFHALRRRRRNKAAGVQAALPGLTHIRATRVSQRAMPHNRQRHPTERGLVHCSGGARACGKDTAKRPPPRDNIRADYRGCRTSSPLSTPGNRSSTAVDKRTCGR